MDMYDSIVFVASIPANHIIIASEYPQPCKSPPKPAVRPD